jgi:hypothetical protein
LFDYYLFVKFLGFLTRKQKHYYLMLYRWVSSFTFFLTFLLFVSSISHVLLNRL